MYRETLALDIRIAARQITRSPLLSLTCVVLLALGLGGTTAAFSALYRVVLRPLPFPDPDRLVVVHSRFPRLHMPTLGVSPLDYRDLSQHSELFSNAGAFFYLNLSRAATQHPEKINAVAATKTLFDTLGVQPFIGRYFTPAEERPGGPHAVILSNEYWRTNFGQDPSILKRHIRLNGESYSIVAVMPPAFHFPTEVTQMWVPIVFQPQQLLASARQSVFLHMDARLAPGITLQQASNQLDQISREAAIRNESDYSIDLNGWKYFLVLMSNDSNKSMRFWTWILFTSVILLFLIVCLNTSGLLFLRSTERFFETSLRIALGASRLRIAQKLITEILMLTLGGGAIGFFVAVISIRLLSAVQQFGTLHLVLPVFLFGAAMTLLTAIICSAYPIWAASRTTPAKVISGGGHQRTASREKQHCQQVLMIIQIALSTVLLVSAGLLVHSVVRVLQAPLGFDATNVLTMQISLPRVRYQSEPSRRDFYETVLEKVKYIPGVKSASACTLLPFGYGEDVVTFRISNQTDTAIDQFADTSNVLPDFFRVLRIPLLKGRYFDLHDAPGSEPAVIVDQTLARRYFGKRNPVGQRIQVVGGNQFSIVGVVGSVKVGGLESANRPMLYFSAIQFPVTDMSLVVWASGAMARLPESIQDIVAKIDSNQPVYNIALLQDRIDHSFATRRFSVSLLICFALIGSGITVIGMYGLLSYSVVLRRREFGIRAAVGAREWDLAVLVFRRGILLLSFGMGIGSLVAVSASRYIARELYDIRIADPLTWIAAVAVLGGAGIFACIAPARDAARTNALSMLKED